MARFDVYRNKAVPYPPFLMQAQSEMHDVLPGRVMIPLILSNSLPANIPEKFMLKVMIEGESYRLIVSEIASIPKHFIGEKIASLETERYEICDAINFLMQGF